MHDLLYFVMEGIDGNLSKCKWKFRYSRIWDWRYYIEVEFADTESVYRYSYESAGLKNVEEMKRLAAQGHGLNSFINRRVKYLYEKWESLVLKGSLFCIAV